MVHIKTKDIMSGVCSNGVDTRALCLGMSVVCPNCVDTRVICLGMSVVCSD